MVRMNLSGFSEIYNFHAMVCKSPTHQPKRENGLMNAKEKENDGIQVVCFPSMVYFTIYNLLKLTSLHDNKAK